MTEQNGGRGPAAFGPVSAQARVELQRMRRHLDLAIRMGRFRYDSNGDPDLTSFASAAYMLVLAGEAGRRISRGVKERVPQIPWHEIAVMRNTLAHAGDFPSHSLVSNMLDEDAPTLAAIVNHVLFCLEAQRPANDN